MMCRACVFGSKRTWDGPYTDPMRPDVVTVGETPRYQLRWFIPLHFPPGDPCCQRIVLHLSLRGRTYPA